MDQLGQQRSGRIETCAFWKGINSAKKVDAIFLLGHMGRISALKDLFSRCVSAPLREELLKLHYSNERVLTDIYG